jgi:hypothetical protein
MSIGRILYFSVAAAALGCAHQPQTAYERSADDSQYFTLRTARGTEQIRLEGDRLFGPDVEVSRLSDGFRGHVGKRMVDLRTADMKVFGSIGSDHTELHVEERPDGFVLKGMYGGSLGSIEMLASRVLGSIGSCSYDMVRAAAETPRYTGRRACLGRVSTVEMFLPADLHTRSAVDRAAMMALFLGN